ncbi:fimbria/pilus outer membrane usher protein [Serratia fonticola]|uniref:fimbria/pilus outer membrane usher protein n=1 Tax=Serratia fonticola TaxID=47917 RepID=UPI00192ABDED|nr:fimbrial biogenesis outer membrane usher protein [Serratia fonticola]
MNKKSFKHSALYHALFNEKHLHFYLSVLFASFIVGAAHAADETVVDTQDVTFNKGFFKGVGKSIDISKFEKKSTLQPGEYSLDVLINDRFIGRSKVRITQDAGSSNVCFRGKDISAWGLNLSKLTDTREITATLASDCVDIVKLLPGAQVNIDQNELSAHLSIPQIYINSLSGDYISPEFWEDGINAAFASYNANAYQATSPDSTTNKNLYVGLNTGLNLWGWNLRHNGSFNVSETQGYGQSQATHSYGNINTYAQHDVSGLEAMATVGQFYTPGDLFDSISFTGVQITSDERMIADSEKGFAPEIRGTAETNAKVTVRQGELVVYETTVAPGPFAINDLSNTGYSGDLNVTITEADGRTKSFVVPYASVSQLLRPGISRFSATMGVYRDTTSHAGGEGYSEPKFIQGTYRRGVSNKVTLYTGGILSDDYFSGLAGMALNTSMGAFAFDITNSYVKNLPTSVEGINNTMNGQSYRVMYSKRLDLTNTELAVAAYRYSNSDYLTLQNVAQLKGNARDTLYRPRERLQMNISQPVGDWGNVYLSGITESSWEASGRSTTYQAGYGTGFSWGTTSVSLGRTYSDGEYNDQLSLMFSIPLGRSRSMTLTNTINSQGAGRYNAQTNLSGTVGNRNQLSYNGFASHSQNNGDSSEQYGGSLNYNGTLSNLGTSVSGGGGYSQYSLSARGTVIGYSGGVAMTASQGESMAIVEAKGASGAEVIGGSGSSVGWWGNSVITSLTPYQNNSVLIDPHGASADVELQSSSANTVPRYGAITRLKFDTVVGKPMLVRGLLDSGKPVPFGADVLDKQNTLLSMVGQGGQILLRGQSDQGSLQIKWGEKAAERCTLTYSVSQKTNNDATGYRQVDAPCH